MADGGTPARTLVVGVGSPLRSDDAVGRAVCEAIGDLGRDDVEVVSVHQLTPELAPLLDGRGLVVFVDASVEADSLLVTELPTTPEPADPDPALTHHLGPAGIVAFAATLGWRPRRAVALGVPVVDLAIGTELTPATAGRVVEVVARVVELLDGEAATDGQ